MQNLSERGLSKMTQAVQTETTQTTKVPSDIELKQEIEALKTEIEALEEKLTWKQANYDRTNKIATIPISWNELKEISIRSLGKDNGSFGYLTIPKEQWHNDGTFELVVNDFNLGGTFVGSARLKVTQKNTDNFIVSVTLGEGVNASMQIYYR